MAGKKKAVNQEVKSPISQQVEYQVISGFRDIKNFDKIYSIGEILNGFDQDRLDSLVAKKLVEVKGLPELIVASVSENSEADNDQEESEEVEVIETIEENGDEQNGSEE